MMINAKKVTHTAHGWDLITLVLSISLIIIYQYFRLHTIMLRQRQVHILLWGIRIAVLMNTSDYQVWFLEVVSYEG